MNNPWGLIDKPVSDFNAILVHDQHPIALYWAVNGEGKFAFIYTSRLGLAPDSRTLPLLSGLTAFTTTDPNGWKLILLLNDEANWEIFASLCDDLVRLTRTTTTKNEATDLILRRLRRWQDFLKLDRPDILSMEKIQGLLGELLFLCEQVAPAFGWSDAIQFWKGPEGAPQDFAVQDTAIEVKCQRGASNPSVRISSASQLDPQLPNGFLAIFTIGTTSAAQEGAVTLNSMVQRVRESLFNASSAARERFEDLMYLAGYRYSISYDEYSFLQVGLKCFRLEPGFPRIVTSDIPLGIPDVSYTILIDACTPFAATPSWWNNHNEN